jgi:murein L,D-transpeptidase YafK
MINLSDFKEQQLAHSRVRSAYDEKETIVKELLVANNIKSGYDLFIRAFKKEQALEVWVKEKKAEKFSLLITYPFCTTSGTIGPKRKEGDLQIPEGFYKVNHFNPYSTFHLSLGINYQNASDKILSDKKHPGGAIYIHGNCVSIGCIPITDDKIKELYILAVDARTGGQENIRVHILPSRDMEGLIKEAGDNTGFWSNLKTIYDDFEKSNKLKLVKVDTSGAYTF